MEIREDRGRLSRRLGSLIRAILVGACIVPAAGAAPITVVNHSFETLPGPLVSCGIDCLATQTGIPGWTNSGVSGQFQPQTNGNLAYFDTLSDGPTSAWTNGVASGGSPITQTVGATVQPGFLYTLLVDIGDRKDTAGGGLAFLLINGNYYGATGTLTDGGWGTFSATYLGTAADAGAAITIELRAGEIQGNFDNVRLSEEAAVPEPASAALLGLGIAGLSFARRSRAGVPAGGPRV